jgi:Protein of unknown function (DUF2934)
MSLEQNASSSKNHENHVAQPVRQRVAEGWVREAAFYIWEKEGRVHGHALDHWLRAERDVRRLVDSGKIREQAW